MKIYDNGELIHVDSSKDIIEHSGIKGMKWGQRRALKKELRGLEREFGGRRNTAVKTAKKESAGHSRLGTLLKSNRSLQYRLNRLKEFKKLEKQLDDDVNKITLSKDDKKKIEKARKEYGDDEAHFTKQEIELNYMMKALDKHDVASSKKNSKVKY